MEKLKQEEISSAADKFAEAMFNDPLHVYFFPDAGSRKKKIKALYSFVLKNQLDSVYKTSSNLEGFAVWKRPAVIPRLFYSIPDGIKLFFTFGIKTIMKMLRYDLWAMKERKKIMKNPYRYLFVIIVDPLYQGKGFANRLIMPVLAEADKNKERCYLETQNSRNIPIYEKFGFRIVKTVKIPQTGLKHYCMMREMNS